MEGLVIRTTGSWYRVASSDGCIECRLRGSYRLRGSKQTNPVVVGDRVSYELQSDGTGLITDIADRTNYIVRQSIKLSKQTHVLAANIDMLCIVASMGSPRTSTGFIDRLLVTAEAYRIPACLLLNKSDLCAADTAHRQLQQEVIRRYRQVGYPVHEVSALTGQGIETVRQSVRGKTVLFSGHSGVGKSALLNALSPGLGLRVGAISDWNRKGMHTTTFTEMHPIGGLDAYLIDTPGIKEFGLVDFRVEELSHFFPEMRRHLHQCHFADCTHRHEPSCAVRAAVDRGEVSVERYQSYLNMVDSLFDTTRAALR
ncbi:MAG: ribosome bioproteinis GTPase [bacterium P3]|nr:MAG: ribosome bioproteinis GTPase [bacterium P3]KWW40158.1 MAG: ribosome bioproteinis GTPase [bacterium F083]